MIPSLRLLRNTARGYSTLRCATDSETITLPDGRRLGYSSYGDRSNRPLLFFHGFPGSRLEVAGVSTLAAKHDIWLISPDRPGFGLSTTLVNRSINDWPGDVVALLDKLEIQRAVILGGSGGGPYALSCASAIPHRLAGVGVLAGAPPWTSPIPLPSESRITRQLCLRAPWLTKRTIAALVGSAKWLSNTQYGAKSPYLSPEVMSIALEGFAQGPSATVQEALLLSQDWGIDFGRIDLPVTVWHGKGDARSPIEIMRWMVDQMPRGKLVEYETGHFDIHTHLDEVVAQLVKEAEW